MGSFGVAVKAAIVRDQQVLVLYKSDKGATGDPDPERRRDLPGGRVQLGESPLNALHREVAEETGLVVTVVAPANIWHYFVPAESFQLVGITYACLYTGGDVCLSDEHDSHEWLTKDQLLQQSCPIAEEYITALKVIEDLK